MPTPRPTYDARRSWLESRAAADLSLAERERITGSKTDDAIQNWCVDNDVTHHLRRVRGPDGSAGPIVGVIVYGKDVASHLGHWRWADGFGAELVGRPAPAPGLVAQPVQQAQACAWSGSVDITHGDEDYVDVTDARDAAYDEAIKDPCEALDGIIDRFAKDYAADMRRGLGVDILGPRYYEGVEYNAGRDYARELLDTLLMADKRELASVRAEMLSKIAEEHAEHVVGAEVVS